MLAAALLAGLVVPAGTAPAQAATLTPSQVVAKVQRAITTSRTVAHRGLRVVEDYGFETKVWRYDGRHNRLTYTSTDGTSGRFTRPAAYYRQTKNPAETAAKTLAGGDARTWIRYPRTEEGWFGPRASMHDLFDETRPVYDRLVSASATPGPGGSTVYSLTTGDPVITFTYTVSRSGLLLRRGGDNEGFANMTFTYGPRTVKVPTDVISSATWRRARTAATLPTKLRNGATQVAREANAVQPSTVPLVRERARAWAAAWNATHSSRRQVSVTDLVDGARLSMVQPFSGATLRRDVVLVDGTAVVK